MRILAVILLLGITACSSHTHKLAETSKSDPLWQLNEGKWAFHENALTTAPREKDTP